MKKFVVSTLFVCLGLALSTEPVQAQFSVTNATTQWTAIGFGSTYPDFYNDQQTGQPISDIVGTTNSPSLYTQFYNGGTSNNLTDGILAFRVRLGAGAAEFSASSFFVGLDANADGALDAFVGVRNQGAAKNYYIGIWDAGTDLNISPSTTSIASSPYRSYTEIAGGLTNYQYTAVTVQNDPFATTAAKRDLDADGSTDYFLSFSVPFADLVAFMGTQGISLTDTSTVRYISVTSNQDNSFNQDLNGINGGVNSASTWAQLGGLSDPFTAGGLAIPEPSAFTLAARPPGAPHARHWGRSASAQVSRAWTRRSASLQVQMRGHFPLRRLMAAATRPGLERAYRWATRSVMTAFWTGAGCQSAGAATWPAESTCQS